MKIRALPRYVSEFVAREGKVRVRFRKTGRATYYPKAALGTDAFALEYQAWLRGEKMEKTEARAERVPPGTFDDLISRYYRSPAWLGIEAPLTRKTYFNTIENFRKDHGDRLVADLRVGDIDKLLGKKADTPSAANNLRKRLNQLLTYAVRIGMRSDNPVAFTKGFKKTGNGYYSWTEDDIEQYEKRWALGTKQHLALALMLYTGFRRSDAVRVGRPHIIDGGFVLTTQKTDDELAIPLHPKLVEAITAMKVIGTTTFLVTEYGRPFTAAGFGGWFREQCDKAGLPHCTAHGLRKAMGRRLAEVGLSNTQIKAVGGWKSDAVVAIYTRGAEQKRLASDAMNALVAWELAHKKPL